MCDSASVTPGRRSSVCSKARSGARAVERLLQRILAERLHLRPIELGELRAGHHVAHTARAHAHALSDLTVAEPALQFLSKYLACLAHR